MALRSRAKGSFFQAMGPQAPSALRDGRANSPGRAPAALAAAFPRRRRELISPRVEVAFWVAVVGVIVAAVVVLGT